MTAHGPWLGGPNTILPSAVESFLSWLLCFACLGAHCYHFVLQTVLARTPFWFGNKIRHFMSSISTRGFGLLSFSCKKNNNNNNNNKSRPLTLLEYYWIPLTTVSRSERDRLTLAQRHEQLAQYITKTLGAPPDEISDRELVSFLRVDDIARRLATLFMDPYRTANDKNQTKNEPSCNNRNESTASADKIMKTTLNQQNKDQLLRVLLPRERLARLWPALLALPTETEILPAPLSSDFDISLIVPAFREKGVSLNRKLSWARQACRNPSKVQVIVVDAGGCTDMDKVVVSQQHQHQQQHTESSSSSPPPSSWGSFQLVEFRNGGGRGPCLNFGAAAAKGKILTFCHSDTRLPKDWDVPIFDTLLESSSSNNNYNNINDNGKSSPNSKNWRASSCAFSFGIDKSPEGLEGDDGNGDGDNGQRSPPGLRAIEWITNIRCKLFWNPYGDQVHSIPRHIFSFVGGYPDQCLMEDYELVVLFRKRRAMLPKLLLSSTNNSSKNEALLPRELLVMLKETALCSPRRWQKFGALYVSFVNANFLHLYTDRGMHPDVLFTKYYGKDPPARKSPLSPWELQLEHKLLDTNTK